MERSIAPVHPGIILKNWFIIPKQLTINELSEGLKIARKNLSLIVNGKAGISPEMALKLAKAFGNTPQFWMNLQSNYELWQAKEKLKDVKIKDYSNFKNVA